MTDVTTVIRFSPDSAMLAIENQGDTMYLAPDDRMVHHDSKGRAVFEVRYLAQGGGEGEMRRKGTSVLARVRGACFGITENQPQLNIYVQVNAELGELCRFMGDEALDFLRRHKVADVADLNGRLCWVELLGGEIRFVRLEPEDDDEETDE
jgi:hypothetical protein